MSEGRSSRGGSAGWGRDDDRGPRREPDRGSRVREEDIDEVWPELPEWATADELAPDVMRDLRGLSKEGAEFVARHLVAASTLAEDEPELAWRHARAARGKGGRIAVVRETVGLVAYRAGQWSEAIAELRAARRMGGGPGHLAVMADCERALGNPEKAIELSRSTEAEQLDDDGKLELTIVVAGARADLGQLETALVVLEGSGVAAPDADARLVYAYADLLTAAGRRDEALAEFMRAHEADEDEVTDAADRIAELAEGTDGEAGGSDDDDSDDDDSDDDDHDDDQDDDDQDDDDSDDDQDDENEAGPVTDETLDTAVDPADDGADAVTNAVTETDDDAVTTAPPVDADPVEDEPVDEIAVTDEDLDAPADDDDAAGTTPVADVVDPGVPASDPTPAVGSQGGPGTGDGADTAPADTADDDTVDTGDTDPAAPAEADTPENDEAHHAPDPDQPDDADGDGVTAAPQSGRSGSEDERIGQSARLFVEPAEQDDEAAPRSSERAPRDPGADSGSIPLFSDDTTDRR